jgi:hypothetical protein
MIGGALFWSPIIRYAAAETNRQVPMDRTQLVTEIMTRCPIAGETVSWPQSDPDVLARHIDDLLAEMESTCGTKDRCRWSLDQPYPLQH